MRNCNHVAARSHIHTQLCPRADTGCSRSEVPWNMAKAGLPSAWGGRETVSEDAGLFWVKFHWRR